MGQIRDERIQANEKEVDVLYQKMGDRWFAFSLIDDELFIGSITQEEIDAGNKACKQNANHAALGNA